MRRVSRETNVANRDEDERGEARGAADDDVSPFSDLCSAVECIHSSVSRRRGERCCFFSILAETEDVILAVESMGEAFGLAVALVASHG